MQLRTVNTTQQLVTCYLVGCGGGDSCDVLAKDRAKHGAQSKCSVGSGRSAALPRSVVRAHQDTLKVYVAETVPLKK